MMAALQKKFLSIVLLALSCSVIATAPPKFSSWVQCSDYPAFQCRTLTAPFNYGNHSGNGSVKNLERRLVAGQPNKHVWILQGGPMENADILLLVLIPQISQALGNNYIIQIPSQRGSQHTDHIADYPAYPSDLDAYLANQTLSLQIFSTSNIARDIIASVKHEQSQHAHVDHIVYGSSYGTFVANRILQMEPALFSKVILDGVLPAISTHDIKSFGLGQLQIPRTISLDCERSQGCRSWSLEQLSSFVQRMADTHQATPCFDLFANLSGSTGPPDQIFDNLAYPVTYSPNIPVPVGIFTNQSFDVQAAFPSIIAWYQGRQNQSTLISWDNRVILWAAINHFAQCKNTTSQAAANFQKRILLPYLNYVTELTAIVAGNASAPSSTAHLVGDHINFGELDLPAWTASQQRALQNNSLVRRPESVLQSIDATRSYQARYFTPLDDYWNKAATNVKADVVMVNGDLDPNTPLDDAQRAFQDLQVASGYNKVLHIVPHGGHAILSTAWSSCNPLFFQAYFAGSTSAQEDYPNCLAEANKETLDWGLEELHRATGFNIWEGLERST